MSAPRVYTVPEVAKELRIGRGAAYSLVNSGQLRAIRVGRSIRIPADAFEEFLASRNGLTATGETVEPKGVVPLHK